MFHLPAIVFPLIKTDGQAEGEKEPASLASFQKSVILLSFSLFPPDFSEQFFPPAHSFFIHTAMLLTGSCSLADKGNELLLYFLHSVQIIHKEDMPITGFAGNIHKLSIVCIRKANSKYDVAWKCISEIIWECQFNQCWYYFKIKWRSQCINHNVLSQIYRFNILGFLCDVFGFKKYPPSICISLDTLFTSSCERPSVRTTRTLGMPLLAPASEENMDSLTCLMARPEIKTPTVGVYYDWFVLYADWKFLAYHYFPISSVAQRGFISSVATNNPSYITFRWTALV